MSILHAFIPAICQAVVKQIHAYKALDAGIRQQEHPLPHHIGIHISGAPQLAQHFFNEGTIRIGIRVSIKQIINRGIIHIKAIVFNQQSEHLVEKIVVLSDKADIGFFCVNDRHP